ncbi:MAG: T9SS type A sorting domain-containing protein, partial [Bacteroidetes bacterium]|nr:T9SS type A sorting domain-containing protein [Bacteroidota bacterium]
MGSGVYVARSSSATSYGTRNGTSFSCPILAGAAALLLSVDPTLTPIEVLSLLRQTASRSSNPDSLMGWGIINALDAVTLILVSVEITKFTGSYINGLVQLKWQTSTETNNSGFEVQKRYEGTSFEQIGFVEGIGSTTEETLYSFTDEQNLVGRIYYQLKQIDSDSGFTFSNEIMVEIPRITDYQLSQNYPNPFNPSTTIKYSVPSQSKIKIALYDIIGNEVSTLFEGVQRTGIHEINLTADNLSSGVYFVSMTAQNFNKVIKITLMK